MERNDECRVIEGGVADDESLVLPGDGAIWGNVGACSIECGGDLAIEGGVLGRGRGRIRVRGNLSARFFSRVTIHAGGDVSALSEINDCTIAAMGRVRVLEGTIAGGHVSGLQGIEADVIGTDAGDRTVVLAGYDTRLEQSIRRLKEKRVAVDANIERIHRTLLPVLEDPKKLNREQLVIMKRLNEQVRVLLQSRERIDKRLKKIRHLLTHGGSRTLFVRGMLFAGAYIDFGEDQKQIRETVAGPVRVWHNDAMRQIKIHAMREPPQAVRKPYSPDA